MGKKPRSRKRKKSKYQENKIENMLSFEKNRNFQKKKI